MIVAAATAALAACAGPVHWHKAGVSEQEASKDEAFCRGQVQAKLRSHETIARERFDSRSIGAGNPLGPEAVDQRLYEADISRLRDRLFADCMSGLGYSAGG